MEEARHERAAEQAEARADAAEARREAREAGEASRLDIHLLDATIKTLSSFQTANAMIEIRLDLLGGQLEHG
ncbi:MAG: hypothetical protein H0V10_13120 [Geodermatophilaceae bacterium]|nr:hypothetical protein [Geodermatophilaceae bacterium]